MSSDLPPKPPPHSSKPSTGPLPPGNYDIFVIPPSSAGSGFLYLPSLRPSPNSFIAGFSCAVGLLILWLVLLPIIRQILVLSTSGGGLLLLLITAAAGAFWSGRTLPSSQSASSPERPDASDSHDPTGSGSGSAKQSSSTPSSGQVPRSSGTSYSRQSPRDPPPSPSQTKSKSRNEDPTAGASSAWERAREETRRREQARKAAAEKLKWEQARAQERESRDREARQRASRTAPTNFSDPGPAKFGGGAAAAAPSVRSCHVTNTDPEPTSFRPYDKIPVRPTQKSAATASYASSVSGASESSWAASAYTSATSAPPSHASFASTRKRGPYTTSDPDKVILGGVHLFTSTSGSHPAGQLLSRQGEVTDGLILRITSEGIFIDDDVRKVPQREWDIKAWSIQLVETGRTKSAAAAADTGGLTVLCVKVRGMENKRYVFVLPVDQAFKVDLGLERLRKGAQVRAMGMSGLKESETRGLLISLGWLS